MNNEQFLQAISDLMDQKIQPIKDELVSVKGEISSMKDEIASVKEDVETVKRDVKHLKKEAIRLQAMDEAILDEVERVHSILDRHKEDSAAHTA